MRKLALVFHLVYWYILALQRSGGNPFEGIATQGSINVSPNTTIVVPEDSQGALAGSRLHGDFTYTVNIKSPFSVICFGYLHQTSGANHHLTLSPLPVTNAYYTCSNGTTHPTQTPTTSDFPMQTDQVSHNL